MLPIPLSVAHSVITSVFPESSPEVSFDTVQLTGGNSSTAVSLSVSLLPLTSGRRESFIQEVKLSAETYKSAAQRMQAVAAASTSAMLEESDAPLFDGMRVFLSTCLI